MSGDLAVWLVFVVALALLGLRAVVVETSPPGETADRDVRRVTIAVGFALGVLVVAVMLQGGLELLDLLRNPPPPLPVDPAVPVPAVPAVPAVPGAPAPALAP